MDPTPPPASTSSTSTFLSSHYLSTIPPDSINDLQSFLDDQRRAEQEAREAMPFQTGECSWERGYVKQSVWACRGESVWGVFSGGLVAGGRRLILVSSRVPSSTRPPCIFDGLCRLRWKRRLLRLFHLVSRRTRPRRALSTTEIPVRLSDIQQAHHGSLFPLFLLFFIDDG